MLLFLHYIVSPLVLNKVIVLYCIVLYCIISCYTVLYRIVSYSIVLSSASFKRLTIQCNLPRHLQLQNKLHRRIGQEFSSRHLKENSIAFSTGKCHHLYTVSSRRRVTKALYIAFYVSEILQIPALWPIGSGELSESDPKQGHLGKNQFLELTHSIEELTGRTGQIGQIENFQVKNSKL